MARTLLARCVAEQVPPGAIPAGPASVGRRHDERGPMTGIASPPEPGWATGPGDEWQTGQQPAVGQAHATEAPHPAASTGGWEWLTPQPPRPAQPAPPAWPAQPAQPAWPAPAAPPAPALLAAWPHACPEPPARLPPRPHAWAHRLPRAHRLAWAYRLPRPLSWPSQPRRRSPPRHWHRSHRRWPRLRRHLRHPRPTLSPRSAPDPRPAPAPHMPGPRPRPQPSRR